MAVRMREPTSPSYVARAQSSMAESTDNSTGLSWQRARSILPWGVTAIAVLAAVAVVGFGRLGNSQGLPFDAAAHAGIPPQAEGNRKVSELEFPAKLLVRTGLDVAGQTQVKLNQPSAIVPAGDMYYVLDAGNGRVVELDHSGQARRTIDASTDERLALRLPMSMVGDKGTLYVADTESRRVVAFEPTDGKVDRVITLGSVDGDKELPRPIGIVVNPQGDIFLSDASNQRVLKYSAAGGLSSFVGTGKRDSGNHGLNTPGGLALDRAGDLYVVDILNSRVMKYSSEGTFLLQVGSPGDTAGSFSRPKGVAVDDHGNIYVSDSMQAAIQVFDPQGKYIGLIGRRQAGNPDADSMFDSPAELRIVDDKLYVTDRLAGLFVFDLKR